MKIVITTRTLVYTALLGVVVVISGVLLGFQIFPKVIRSQIWKNSILEEGSRQWEFFKKIPFPFHIKVHFFDVQNEMEILQGAKPVVKERGPYIYKLFRWKNEIEWNDDEISYYDYTRLEFDQEASGQLSENDIVTILNAPFNSLIQMIEEISPDGLESVDLALPTIFGKSNGLFMTAKVRQLLFDGMVLCENGGADDFTAQMICDQFKVKAKDSKPMDVVGNSINYAYLRYKNYTHLGRFTVNSGLKDYNQLNNLIQFENASYIKTWNGGKSMCNKIRGTTTFHPYITTNMSFDVFGEDLCRMFVMEYSGTGSVKGINGFKFTVPNTTFGKPSIDSSDYCYCVNRSKNLDGEYSGCLDDGLLDMTTCMGAPVLLSFPHLLYTDRKYTSTVQGLHPEESRHEIFAILEPTLGIPLKMAKRVQFNMFIRPVQDIISIENLTNSVMPILWLEESVTLPDDMVKMLKPLLMIFTAVEVIKWGLVALGAITICISLALIVAKN